MLKLLACYCNIVVQEVIFSTVIRQSVTTVLLFLVQLAANFIDLFIVILNSGAVRFLFGFNLPCSRPQAISC